MAKQSQEKSDISDLEIKDLINRTPSDIEFEKTMRNAAGITRL